MNPILKPLFDDAVTRWAKWKNPSQADAVRLLGPALEAVCLDAKIPAARATEWLQAQAPETITREAIDAFVRDVTEVPLPTLEFARARMEQLNREIASERPRTARELVMEERAKPLSERTFESIQAEQFEVNGGHIRIADSESPSGFRRGAKLPDAVWANMPRTDEELQAELDRRECAAYGVTYRPAVADKRDNLAYLPAMRG